MDKRKKYMVVIDTETCPLDRGLAEISPYNMFTYDCGFAVVDKKGNVYEKFSFVCTDIFLEEKALMKSAYYAEKVPAYWNDIKAGTRKLTTFYNMRKTLLETIKKYNVTEIYAHNMRFDHGTLNNTYRWLTKSKFRYFFPKNVIICDTLKMARQVIGKMPTYKKFCEENNYKTKNGQLRFTAEIIYRFISKDNEFIESHTGLEDVLIEKEILTYCYKQKKKMEKRLWA